MRCLLMAVTGRSKPKCGELLSGSVQEGTAPALNSKNFHLTGNQEVPYSQATERLHITA